MGHFRLITEGPRQRIRVNGRGLFITNSTNVEFSALNEQEAIPLTYQPYNSSGINGPLLQKFSAWNIPFELNGWLWIDTNAQYNLYEPEPYKQFNYLPGLVQVAILYDFVPLTFTVTNVNLDYPQSSEIGYFSFGLTVTGSDGTVSYPIFYSQSAILLSVAIGLFMPFAGVSYKGLDGYSGFTTTAPATPPVFSQLVTSVVIANLYPSGFVQQVNVSYNFPLGQLVTRHFYALDNVLMPANVATKFPVNSLYLGDHGYLPIDS